MHTTGVCAQTPSFIDKDTILSHMDMFIGLKYAFNINV